MGDNLYAIIVIHDFKYHQHDDSAPGIFCAKSSVKGDF
jgi:hypothetical protein